jgi:hypothetical protein
MDSKEKYFKYKKKYLELKRKLGGSKKSKDKSGRHEKEKKHNKSRRDDDNKIITKENSGRLEKSKIPGKKKREIYHQCFWMSILDYLNVNGYPELTLLELRNQAGLDITTEQKMFDSTIETFREAAEQICSIYNLQIGIIQVGPDGSQTYSDDFLEVIGSGDNKFRIAQFPSRHFELILESSETSASKLSSVLSLSSLLSPLEELSTEIGKK